jgi:hypothetical protein
MKSNKTIEELEQLCEEMAFRQKYIKDTLLDLTKFIREIARRLK